MSLVMECVVSVYSDKEGFLLYSGVNIKEEEGLYFHNLCLYSI